jgi:hypothetical protein
MPSMGNPLMDYLWHVSRVQVGSRIKKIWVGLWVRGTKEVQKYLFQTLRVYKLYAWAWRFIFCMCMYHCNPTTIYSEIWTLPIEPGVAWLVEASVPETCMSLVALGEVFGFSPVRDNQYIQLPWYITKLATMCFFQGHGGTKQLVTYVQRDNMMYKHTITPQ